MTLPPTFTTVVDLESGPDPPPPNAIPNAIPTPNTTAQPATPRAWARTHEAVARPRPAPSRLLSDGTLPAA